MNDPTTADWLGRALARPGTEGWAEVPGNRIHYLEWEGPPGAPGMLLVHGFRAHAHWWDFIAPQLAEDYRVVAMDLGGMGDSGHRSHYGLDTFTGEIAGVLRHLQLRDATLVGHSFGGLMSIGVCHQFPELVARAVVIDSRVSFPDDDVRSYQLPQRTKKRYASLNTALQFFRLVPEQGGVAAPIFDHVAHHSAQREGDDWVWKFDDTCFAPNLPLNPLTDGEMLAQARMPIDFICGEHSVTVDPVLARRIGASLPAGGRGPIVIPDANHHVLLDQPLALTAALRALLAR